MKRIEIEVGSRWQSTLSKVICTVIDFTSHGAVVFERDDEPETIHGLSRDRFLFYWSPLSDADTKDGD